MRRTAGVATLVLLAAPGSAQEGRWRVEAALGAAHSFGSTLEVEQAGSPALRLPADWATRALETPLYYGLRVARADARGAWALRFVHHKAYLENTTPEIERFSVSHGYNLLTVERAFPRGALEVWAGAGVVIAHPESTIRGRTRDDRTGGPLGGGYYPTGPTGALAVSWRLRLGRHLALVPEARLTLSRARVPVADGEASVPNAAAHVLLGLEARF